MSEKLCVSIIIPIYNAAPYIQRCIDVLSKQDFVKPFEIIIVDDASTDKNLKNYLNGLEKDEKISVTFRDTNGHISAATNSALSLASGEFVTFLDHDDVYESEKLSCMLAAAERHPNADAIIGPNRMWYSWDEESQRSSDSPQVLGITTETVLAPPGMINGFLANSSKTPLGPLFRTKTLRTLGGYDPTFKDMHEDQVFMVRLMLKHPIVVIDDVLHRYRQHTDSCVAQTHANGKDKQARYRFLSWMKEELDRQDSRHPELDKQIDIQLKECRRRHGRRLQRVMINLRETLTGRNQ